MDASAFTQQFPKLYHVTLASNFEGIRKHGLQSSQKLAEIYAFTSEERKAALDMRRRCIQDIRGISIRDQHTAHESKMKSCLVKITIPEWFSLLNSKIFFFLSREKSEKLAEVYADYENILFEVDTKSLLSKYADHVTVCRINSGSFLYNPRPRGRDSFISLSRYIYKNKRDTPAELTVDIPIPNILDISAISVLTRRGTPSPAQSDRA